MYPERQNLERQKNTRILIRWHPGWCTQADSLSAEQPRNLLATLERPLTILSFAWRHGCSSTHVLASNTCSFAFAMPHHNLGPWSPSTDELLSVRETMFSHFSKDFGFVKTKRKIAFTCGQVCDAWLANCSCSYCLECRVTSRRPFCRTHAHLGRHGAAGRPASLTTVCSSLPSDGGWSNRDDLPLCLSRRAGSWNCLRHCKHKRTTYGEKMRTKHAHQNKKKKKKSTTTTQNISCFSSRVICFFRTISNKNLFFSFYLTKKKTQISDEIVFQNPQHQLARYCGFRSKQTWTSIYASSANKPSAPAIHHVITWHYHVTSNTRPGVSLEGEGQPRGGSACRRWGWGGGPAWWRQRRHDSIRPSRLSGAQPKNSVQHVQQQTN